MEQRTFEKRNERPLRAMLKEAGSFETGTSKSGAKILVANGQWYSCSDSAFAALDVKDESWKQKVDDFQVFEYLLPAELSKDGQPHWVPCICGKGHMANANRHTCTDL